MVGYPNVNLMIKFLGRMKGDILNRCNASIQIPAWSTPVDLTLKMSRGTFESYAKKFRYTRSKYSKEVLDKVVGDTVNINVALSAYSYETYFERLYLPRISSATALVKMSKDLMILGVARDKIYPSIDELPETMEGLYCSFSLNKYAMYSSDLGTGLSSSNFAGAPQLHGFISQIVDDNADRIKKFICLDYDMFYPKPIEYYTVRHRANPTVSRMEDSSKYIPLAGFIHENGEATHFFTTLYTQTQVYSLCQKDDAKHNIIDTLGALMEPLINENNLLYTISRFNTELSRNYVRYYTKRNTVIEL